MAKIKIDDLQKVLKEKKAKWEAKENHISLMEEKNQKKLLGAMKPVDEVQELSAVEPVAGFVLERDWRTTSNVTPVKDQAQCGSCVSFGTLAVVESMVSIEKSQTVNLSEADLHFCSSHGANCDGWWPSTAFSSVKTNGVTDEVCFPYNSAFVNGVPVCNCCTDKANRLYKITTINNLYTATDAKNYLTNYGPVAAAIDVYSDFYNYSSGVYHHVTGTYQGGHCIAIVGYSETEQCWICKNSWGTGWGDNGYFKIAYGDCNIDVNQKWGATGVILPGTPPPPPPPTYTLSVSPTSLSVTATAGTKSIAVTSNTTWNVSTTATWCSLSSTSGTGNSSIAVVYESNTSTTTSRSATITFTGASTTINVTLIQAKAPKKKGKPVR